jgi:hypothetical protein
MLYNDRLNSILLEPHKAKDFSKFSLKPMEQINTGPLKIILKEPNQRLPIPLPIFSDPFVWIDIDFIAEKSKNYKFELSKFYLNVNQKVKY